MNSQPTIALLTDFGQDDAYVGVMKGVILSICPAARLVDLTHSITPQNVRQAAYVLLTSVRYFPDNTVFLVVVDPGVGTTRAAIAVQSEHGIFVAPDNGVLHYALKLTPITASVRLETPAYVLPHPSRTFHGRDIFAPAAAHLACGVALADLGPAHPRLETLDDPVLEIASRNRQYTIRGEILHIDRFGNIITSIGGLTWLDTARLRLAPVFGQQAGNPETDVLFDAASCSVTLTVPETGAHTFTGIRSTYGEVPAGAALALVGSSGQLDSGLNQGHAARLFGASLDQGAEITLETQRLT